MFNNYKHRGEVFAASVSSLAQLVVMTEDYRNA
jgi:hypothetical protein